MMNKVEPMKHRNVGRNNNIDFIDLKHVNHH